MNEHHHHPCDDFTIAVTRCHRRYGKLGEDCVREELAQKRCFAELFCKHQSRRFYEEKSIPLNATHNNNGKWSLFSSQKDYSSSNEQTRGAKVSCATLVEAFAKPENELLIPESISKDDRKHCRKIVHELSTCLSTKPKPTASF